MVEALNRLRHSSFVIDPSFRHSGFVILVIRDNSWNSCRAFGYFMSTRESQQSDNATRSRYRRESQRYGQFPRAIMIDSFAEIDERPARRHFRSFQVAPQYPLATAPPARLPAID